MPATTCRRSRRSTTPPSSGSPIFPPGGLTIGLLLAVSILLTVFIRPVMSSSWEFAVTTNDQIIFYDNSWTIVGTAAHQFKELSSIAYDEAEDTIYFNVRKHPNASIFSLNLIDISKQNQHVEHVVAKTPGETVNGIAFDPLDRVLYWTDSSNNNIMRAPVDRVASTATAETAAIPSGTVWLNGTEKMLGIAVDACRRRLYWTTVSSGIAAVHRASLSGAKSEVIVSKDMMYLPLGIVVDQYEKRLFWVDDLQGIHFSVESSSLDGSDHSKHLIARHHTPQSIAVDRDTVYWTDISAQRSIWKTDKTKTSDPDQGPIRVANLTSAPNGIIVRTHLLSSQASNADCSATIEGMRQNMQLVGTTTAGAIVTNQPAVHNFCLNEAELNVKTNKCICRPGYSGNFCQENMCKQYCLRGTCQVSTTGTVQCSCDKGFGGDRCQNDVCTSYCLNGGHCSVTDDGAAECQCSGLFGGQRCDRVDNVEACRRYCEDTEILEGFDMHRMCGNCTKNTPTTPATVLTASQTIAQPHQELKNATAAANVASACDSTTSSAGVNTTVILVTVGVVCGLVLVYLIISGLRRFYKPIRPKIRKTFVVRNKMDRKNRTPLTCRPAPEQCEITIENCCNMNICDTPCFDPQTIQQEMNKEAARKEDKYKLLSNMEGDLY